MRAHSRLPLALALLALAPACGGGGGGAGRSAAATPRPAPDSSSGGGGSPFSSIFAGGGGAAGMTAFQSSVYPLLRSYCTACHVGSGPGFPHISHPDGETAFRAVVDNQKVNLSTPASSRLVQRLSADRHHCWSSDCAVDAAAMQAAIQFWADQVVLASGGVAPGGGTPNPSQEAGLIASDSTTLATARPLASTRSDAGAIALWKFESGSGTTALDTSGVAPTMDLTLSAEGVSWLAGGGLIFAGGRARATVADSRKLFNRIASGNGSQEYTIEAWIVPASIDQVGPARIVSYAEDGSRRNFMMGQTNYNYVFRNRSLSAGINLNGDPALSTPDAEEDLQAQLQHAVLTYDQSHGRRIFVNGVWTEDEDPELPGLLVAWDPRFRFAIGNEVSGDRPWNGQVRLVAIYDRALSAERILQNFLAGASREYALRFSLDNWLPGASITLQVSDFDPYSYLFCFPTLETPVPSGFAAESLRIAVNGVAPVASQSFRSIAAVVDEPSERLSELCSVVPKDLGLEADSFEVLFDVLDTQVLRTDDPPGTPSTPPLPSELRPDNGIRDFAEINDSMSELTGVPVTFAPVLSSYQELAQQLPGSNDLRSFVSSQQVAIAKLALEYCDAMVDSPSLRSAFFGSFPFGSAAPAVFGDPLQRAAFHGALSDNLLGSSLASQPTPVELSPVLDTLIDALLAPCASSSCGPERTVLIAKASCAAVLSSAAVQLH